MTKTNSHLFQRLQTLDFMLSGKHNTNYDLSFLRMQMPKKASWFRSYHWHHYSPKKIQSHYEAPSPRMFILDYTKEKQPKGKKNIHDIFNDNATLTWLISSEGMFQESNSMKRKGYFFFP